MQRSPLKRYTPLSRKAAIKRTPLKKKRKKIQANLPDWFRSLRYGSHGSTPIQKKAWAYISDMVRQSDFRTYGGKCVSCPRYLTDWRDGDCAHFVSWSVCNGMFRYNTRNLALSCRPCNAFNNSSIGYEFAEELKRRHGPDIITDLYAENASYHGTKLHDEDVLAMVVYFKGLE